MEDIGTPETGRSRRERPAKPALTRDGIVATAAAIFRSEGLSKVTMRSVAKALDTGHASLYVYVRNTEDLHAQVLDVELGSVALPDDSRPWRASLVALLLDYGRVLLSHAEIARMAIRTRPDGPHYVALVEAVLRQLDRGGVTGQAAAWGVDILLQYPAAVAAEHGRHTGYRSPGPRPTAGSAGPYGDPGQVSAHCRTRRSALLGHPGVPLGMGPQRAHRRPRRRDFAYH